MRREDIKVGARVIFTDKERFRDSPPHYPDVFGQVGTIREVNDNNDCMYITWDDPTINNTIRGQNYWSLSLFGQLFKVATQEEIEQQQDQKRREEHAMKYL